MIYYTLIIYSIISFSSITTHMQITQYRFFYLATTRLLVTGFTVYIDICRYIYRRVFKAICGWFIQINKFKIAATASLSVACENRQSQWIRRSYISHSLGSVSSKSTLYSCVVSPSFSDSSVFKSWNKYATSEKYEKKDKVNTYSAKAGHF